MTQHYEHVIVFYHKLLVHHIYIRQNQKCRSEVKNILIDMILLSAPPSKMWSCGHGFQAITLNYEICVYFLQKIIVILFDILPED